MDPVGRGATSALAGRIAIVTGGGRGFGKAIALALASSGAAVGVIARSAEQIREVVNSIKEASGRALAVEADVTRRDQVEKAVRVVERTLGPADLLVSAVGSGSALDPIWKVDPDLWWRDVEVNLRGPFLAARAVLPGMLARQHGRIVILVSGSGLGPFPGALAYAAGKAGAIRFVDSLAVEAGEHGLRVFAVQPGVSRTELVDGLLAWSRRYLQESTDGIRSEAVRQMAETALGWERDGAFLPPEQVVSLVLFLASGRADALSGRFLSARDDLEDLVRRADEIQRDDLYSMRLRR